MHTLLNFFVAKESSVDNEGVNEQKVKQSTRSTQTEIILPPILPPEVEEVLLRYKLINGDENVLSSVQCISSPATIKPQFISKSYSRITSMISNTSGMKCKS